MASKENVNGTNRRGTSKLIEAIKKGNIALSEKLIETGADVHFKTQAPTSLLGSMLNTACAIGATPLHVAGLCGSAKIIRLLLDRNADVNAKDSKGMTPTDYAVLGWAHAQKYHDKKSAARFSLKKQFAATRLDSHERAIESLLKAGGEPAMHELPDNFKPLHRQYKKKDTAPQPEF